MKTAALRRFAILVGLVGLGAAFNLASGCRPTVVIKDAGHIVADCSAPAVRSIAGHILDDVATALVTTDYTGGIVAIVTKIAMNAVETERDRAIDEAWAAAKCAVTEVRNQTSTHLGYGISDPKAVAIEATSLTNASAWLASH